MNIRDRAVRYFLKIAEQSSVSKAATDLQLSESGLSRTLSELEHYLGSPLFRRTGRGMELTDVGRELAQVARSAYGQVDTVLLQLRDQCGATRRDLRLAIVHTVGYYFMSDLFANFVSTHASVNLSIMARTSPEVVDLVERKQADVGFVYDSAVASDLVESTPLFVDQMCLISRAAVGSASVDLTAMHVPLIGFPETYALRHMLRYAGLDDRVVAIAETTDTMLDLVSAGVGLCVLPARVPASFLKEHGLTKRSIDRPSLQQQVVAIVHRTAPLGTLGRQLVAAAYARAKFS